MEHRILPDESVRHGHLVKVGLLSVDKVGVWPPDPVEELPVEHKLVNISAVEQQPLVRPVLPEVDTVQTVHKTGLPEVDVQCKQAFGLVHLTHGPHIDVNLNNRGVSVKLWSVICTKF